MSPKTDQDLMHDAFLRERKARKAAEELLDKKSLELFQLSEQLKVANARLREEVEVTSEALLVQERKYESLIKIVQDIIFTISKEGNILFVNPAIKSVLGYGIDEFVGTHISHYIPGDYLEEILSFYTNQLKEKTPNFYLEIPMIHKNGETRWIGLKTEINTSRDDEARLIGMARDITQSKLQKDELKSMRDQLEKQAAFLEEINDYSLSLMDKHSVLEIVQEVTGRLITKLGFETCAIYLREGNELTQVDEDSHRGTAEPGRPKSPARIGIGEGIIGAAAETGKPEIITDTTLDKRYIASGHNGLSELAVPIIADGEVIGVIDSEHSERDFFTHNHLSFVETIASLIGNKIKATNILELAGKRIRRSEEKYRGVIENMKLGLMEVDANSIITRPYPGFCEMTGYRPEELIGKNANDVFLNKKNKDLMQMQDRARYKGISGVYEIELLHKDGSVINVIISGAPFYDDEGKVAGSIGIHYNISELKELQHDLEKARLIAESARDAQKNFLANMSHEIRNPIHSIYGMSELLGTTDLDATQKQYLNNIKSAADILRALVSDILDISKIDEGKMELRESDFEIRELLDNITNYTQTLLRDKNVHFLRQIDPDIPGHLHGDKTFLSQILMNLVSNAVKFTDEGSIELHAKLITTTPSVAEVEFSIRDTGQGIPPDRVEHIFERFRQAGHAIKEEQKGTGLGLAIVKNLAKIMGGDIRVESQLGNGSVFTARIPFKIVASSDALKSDAQILEKSLSILIVEDSMMNRNYLETVLTRLGHQWHSCENGQEAVEATRGQKFDLILMDIRMPVMGGYDAAMAIRAGEDNPNRDTPIIALTASALLDEKEKAMASGMNYHLSKPFTIEQLQEAIGSFFHRIDLDLNADMEMELGEGIDKSALEELYAGDWDHVLLMMQVFRQNAESVLASIREAYETKDWKSLRGHLHKLKPGLMMIGLRECHDRLVEVEGILSGTRIQEEELNTSYMIFMSKLKNQIPDVDHAIKVLKNHLK